MPKDLALKISTLVKDIETMKESDKIRTIERFMNHEFEMLEVSRSIRYNDVAQIHGRASAIMRDVPPDLHLDGKRLHDYPELVRTICFVQATYEFLRAQKMTAYLLSFGDRNGKRL